MFQQNFMAGKVSNNSEANLLEQENQSDTQETSL
jgi:hypothetical protein